MLSQENLLDLIGRIYDAAADERLWPVFLEGFANAVGGTGTALLYHDFLASWLQIETTIRLDPEYIRNDLQHYYLVDSWKNSALARFPQGGSESIVPSEDLVDLNQLRKSEFYNDYLLPLGSTHQLGCMIAKVGRWRAAFTCLRSSKTGPFGPAEIGLLRLLFPHLKRAVQFHRQVAELEGRFRASLDAMDRLANGVIFLDERGRIKNLNRAARRALDQNDGLRAEKDGLAASNPKQTRTIRAMIASAALTVEGEGVAAGGEIGIARPSGKRPFVVLITPVALSAFPRDARRPAVIVFVSDPEEKTRPAAEVFCQIYDLTAAESRLAERLMQGETLVGAAEQLRVSHNTARTHLQRIYQKTNTKHQGELVRSLMAGSGHLSNV